MADGAAGTAGGAAGLDQCSGRTSSAISSPSRSGLTPTSTRSGVTGIYLYGTPYSGPARTTPTVQPMPMVQTIMTSTVYTHMRARREGAQRVVPAPKSRAQFRTKPIWPRAAAALRRA